jgi:hypothetical protein
MHGMILADMAAQMLKVQVEVGKDSTALKFSGLWGLVSGFPRLVTVWLHVGRGGVTGCGGP